MVLSKMHTHISIIVLARPVLKFPQFHSQIHQAVQHVFNMCLNLTKSFKSVDSSYLKINGSISSPYIEFTCCQYLQLVLDGGISVGKKSWNIQRWSWLGHGHVSRPSKVMLLWITICQGQGVCWLDKS